MADTPFLSKVTTSQRNLRTKNDNVLFIEKYNDESPGLTDIDTHSISTFSTEHNSIKDVTLIQHPNDPSFKNSQWVLEKLDMAKGNV